MKYQSKNKLSPEYGCALAKLTSCLQTLSFHGSQEFVSSDIMYQDNVQKIVKPFESRNIPSGNQWRWNQAKARKTVEFPLYTVTFFKLQPRKTSDYPVGCSVPSLKLWKYCVQPRNQQSPFYFLWCERGISDDTTTSGGSNCCSWLCRQSFVPNIDLSIEDFDFLAPFMDHIVASELWPSSNSVELGSCHI